MEKIKTVIAGCSGRMGKALLEGILQSADLTLHAALEHASSLHLGKDAGELVGGGCGVKITAGLDEALQGADILIDFTRPEGTMLHLERCIKYGVPMVIGTTGFSAEQKLRLNAASKQIGMVFSPNMGVGVNLVFKLLEMASKVLSHGYDIEIIEAHHRHKVDAPSGTALGMGEVIARTLGRDLGQCAVYGREGVTGNAILPRSACNSSGGDIVEIILFYLRVSVNVLKLLTRRAVVLHLLLAHFAARFLQEKSAGMFDMQDVQAEISQW